MHHNRILVSSIVPAECRFYTEDFCCSCEALAHRQFCHSAENYKKSFLQTAMPWQLPQKFHSGIWFSFGIHRCLLDRQEQKDPQHLEACLCADEFSQDQQSAFKSNCRPGTVHKNSDPCICVQLVTSIAWQAHRQLWRVAGQIRKELRSGGQVAEQVQRSPRQFWVPATQPVSQAKPDLAAKTWQA